MKHILRLTFLYLTVLTVALFASCGGETNPPSHTEGGTKMDTNPVTPPPESSASTESESDIPETEPTPPPITDMTVPAVYPVPLFISAASAPSVAPGCLTLSEEAAPFAATLCDRLGIPAGENGLPVTLTYRELGDEFDDYLTEEGYILSVTSEGISITAETPRGAYYAIQTLSQITVDGRIPAVTIKDAPRHELRGVIEGFYGTAWTHDFRKALFAFMGDNKMNLYIYAPKDDPKHRTKWRESYTGAELERMQELIDTASGNYVKFVYAISPGGDINLGTGYDRDFTALMDKCESMYQLGVRDFAIFLDDILTLDAEGHAKLLNDFQTKFIETHEGVSDLIAITTEYCDPMLTSYTNKIAPLIHEDIELMWTGPGVVTPSITNQSLKAITRKFDRKMFIWWNYPVNDVLVNNLYMGACEGLETTLYQSISGLVANPMNQGNASLVPLFTTADYLWNPEAYDKSVSLSAAASHVAPDVADALLTFIGMTSASPMNENTDSTHIKALLDAYKADKSPENILALVNAFDRIIHATDELKGGENQALYAEIREWSEKLHAYGVMGKAFFEMELEYTKEKDPEVLLPLLGTYKEAERSMTGNPRLVSNFVLTPFFQTLGNRMNMLLGLGETITCAPATPITDCAHYQNNIPAHMTDGDDSTYFWTAGTLAQASNNGVGYFGVDLGQVMTVTNVYVATGVAGSDALASAAFEYSTDNKTWTRIEEGSYKAEIFLDGLSIEARYIRMRGTDKSNTNWTKVRTFEVNTTRRPPAESGSLAVTAETNLPVYSSYAANLLCDGNDATFFWSAREGRTGDYIQIDLGTPTPVTRVIFKSGVDGHTADYIHNGELAYSTDGQSWTTLCKITGRETVFDANITARYLRVTVKANQTNWITVSEFAAIGENAVSDCLALDEDFVPRSDLMALLDGHVTTLFAPNDAKADGHILTIRSETAGDARILAVQLPKNGAVATVRDQNGHEKTVTLTYSTIVTIPEGGTVDIHLGDGLILAEIIL